MANKPKPIDWEAVEREFRIGRRSLRDIGSEFGCSDTAIRHRAKAEGWSRDLAAKVRARADEILRTRKVRSGSRSLPTERQAVESEAKQIAERVESQRDDTSQARSLVRSMLDELQAVSGNAELFEKVGEILDMSDDDNRRADKLNELYQAVIALPGRADVLRKLGDTLVKLVDTERRIWKMDAEGAQAPIMDIMREVIGDGS